MTEITMPTLTPADAAALNGYEVIISRGLDAFAAAGRAMLAINEQRLYRQTHATFADYCRDRWGMSDRHVRRLMLAADIVTKMVEIVGPIGPIPTTESQARELVGLEPEVAILVMEKVVSATPTVTAAAIAEVRHEFCVRPGHDHLLSERCATPSRPPRVARRPLKDNFDTMLWDLEKVSTKVNKILSDDRLTGLAHHHPRRGVGRLTSIITELTALRDAMAGDDRG